MTRTCAWRVSVLVVMSGVRQARACDWARVSELCMIGGKGIAAKRFLRYLRAAVNGGCLCPTSSLAPARPRSRFHKSR